MHKHPDGCVTFSKEEFEEIRTAYLNMRRILNRLPKDLGNYFPNRVYYVQVEKWASLLQDHNWTPEEEKELLEE